MAERFSEQTLAHQSGPRLILDKDGFPQLRVAILTPCQDTVSAGYAHDLARLTGANHATSLVLLQSKGTIIPQQRATLVNKALEAGATHCLFVDSDMRFPPDALGRLLSHNQPIVAANYPTRRAPILPTAEHKVEGSLFTSPDSDGLVEVSHCGLGLMLVQSEVFTKIGKPYFALGYSPADDNYVGEDFFFCKKAREKGYQILIDQGLSKEVRHVGEMEYTHEHANVTREYVNSK